MIKGKYGTKLYAEADLRLRMLPVIPDFKQNSLILHDKNLTKDNLFCVVDWLNRQRRLLLFVYKLKEPKLFSRSLVTLYWKLTNCWSSVKYLILEWGIKDDIVRKLLFYRKFSCCVENCASTTYPLLIPTLYLCQMMSLNGKAHRTSDRTLFIYLFLFRSLLFIWHNSPLPCTRVSLFPRFLDHTRRNTVARTLPDEWSARRRDVYMTVVT